jgi:hypothetical protein
LDYRRRPVISISQNILEGVARDPVCAQIREPNKRITQALPNTCPRLAQQHKLPESLAAPLPDDFS